MPKIHKINNLALGKKNTQKIQTKPKPAGRSKPIRKAHMCVLITMYSCGTQYNTEQF